MRPCPTCPPRPTAEAALVKNLVLQLVDKDRQIAELKQKLEERAAPAAEVSCSP